MLGNPRKRKAGRIALAAALLLLPAQASFAQAIEGDGTEPAIPHEAIPAPAPATGPALMMPTPTLVEPEAPIATPDTPGAPVHAPAAEPAGADMNPGSAGQAADEIADIFSKMGDQIYEDCIFDLSE